MAEVACIKCGTKYQEKDDEAYYCPPCLEEKNKLAAEIDSRIAQNPTKQTMSGIQLYDSLPKFKGFVRAKDLGI